MLCQWFFLVVIVGHLPVFLFGGVRMPTNSFSICSSLMVANFFLLLSFADPVVFAPFLHNNNEIHTIKAMAESTSRINMDHNCVRWFDGQKLHKFY